MQWIFFCCIEIIRQLYASGHTAFGTHKYHASKHRKKIDTPRRKKDTPPAVCGKKYGYFNVTGAADVAQKRSTGRFFVCTTIPHRCRGPPVRSSIKNSDKEVIRYAEAE